MSMDNYTDGPTFVAFMDISGFKNHMKNGTGIKTLETFYHESYEILKSYETKINSIFISDCGVLFVRKPKNEAKKLKILLNAIRKINVRMLDDNIILTTSIAYGEFRYQNRFEFPGMIKNKVYGNAYVNAVLDAERKKQKIQPGQCRILKDGFPIDLSNEKDNIFDLIKDRNYYTKNHFFYWSLSDNKEIDSFEEKYKNAYKFRNKIGYNLIIDVLKDHANFNLIE